MDAKLLREKRKVLPKQLQESDESLVEKYVTAVSFIYRGVENGKELLLQAEETLSNAANERARQSAQAKVNFAKRTLPKRHQLYYPNEEAPLLSKLELLGLISFVPDQANKKMFRAVKLTGDFNGKTYEEILTAYRGIYPPVLHHAVANDPQKLFHKVVSGRCREETILRPCDAKATPDWSFHVPLCFNNALDIKLQSLTWNKVEYISWTQGSNFAFKKGDVLYLNLTEYQKGTPAIQIKAAEDAMGTDILEKPEKDEKTHTQIKARITGKVVFTDFDGKEKSMTQDDFVYMLITGKGITSLPQKFDANGQGLLF